MRYLADQAAAAGVGARRPHDPDRALPRRARRLAHLRALAVRRTHPRALGDGGGRARPRRDRARRRDDVDRRRVRGAVSGDRGAAGPAADDAGVGRSRSARAAAARRHGAVRREVPRGRRRGRCCCRSAGPGGRSPLWQQRKRAADLLAVAAQFGSFPMLLETYRECLRDVFDMPALVDTLRRIETREIRAVTVDSTMPSPFASALLFGYVANYIYDGDAPLAERRAQALAIDQAQLRELLGEAELRELLDADALARGRAPAAAAGRDASRARAIDGVHDLLLRLGDLTAGGAGGAQPRRRRGGARRAGARRAAPSRSTIAGEPRVHPGRVRRPVSGRARRAAADRPAGVAARAVRRTPAHDLARRYARTHGPFTTERVRRALRRSAARPRRRCCKELAAAGRLLEGEFRPGGTGREWCDPDVLQSIRRRSLAQAAQGGRAGRAAGPRPAAHVAGRASSAGAPGSTRCSTRSRTCRARRCRRRSSRARSSRRASRATTPPTSTR